MKKEVKEIIQKGEEKFIRITTTDERWYARPIVQDGIQTFKYYPSVTWISSFYPKGIAFWKWLAAQGWDEAELAKEEAGTRGTKIHLAINQLLNNKIVKIDDVFEVDGQKMELTADEYQCVIDAADWLKTYQTIRIAATEYTAFNDADCFAGTIDAICYLDGQLYLIDFKTSQEIWPAYEAQLSAYAHLDVNLRRLGIKSSDWTNKKLAILQVGYNRTRRGWKFTEIAEQYDLFLAVKKIWEKECSNLTPLQRDYPLQIKI